MTTTSTAVDMYTPAQTCTALGVAETALLDMVNTGRLGAYNLGGTIRFKQTEVHAAANQFAAA